MAATGRRGSGRARGAGLALLGTALALAFLHGCASEPRGERSVLLGSEQRSFLILPLNVATPMPPELEPFSPIVWEELEIYLRAQGKELKTISRQAAHNLWLRSIRQVRAGENGARAGYDDAARALALELRNHAEFDAMIAPGLFVRKALIADRSAYWDGVVRELEFEAGGLEAWRLDAARLKGIDTEPEGVETQLEGVAPAASLRIAVFDAQGEKLHEALGGLELLVRVRVVGNSSAGGPSFRFTTRTGLFEDRKYVQEGIRVAFTPFLPPLPE